MCDYLVMTVPNVEYDDMMKEVSSIKLSKRKAWKSWSKHASGQKTNIYYSSEPLVLCDVKTHLYKKTCTTQHKTKEQLSMAAFSAKVYKIKDVEVLPVISLDQELFLKNKIVKGTFISTADVDNDVDMIDNMYQNWADNATGNHYRNHSIGVRTEPGQPIRG